MPERGRICDIIFEFKLRWFVEFKTISLPFEFGLLVFPLSSSSKVLPLGSSSKVLPPNIYL